MGRIVDYLTRLCETTKREELMGIPGWKYRVLKTMFGLMVDTIENHSTHDIPSCEPYKRYTRIARDALNFSSEDLHAELREVRDDVYLASPTEYPASAAEDVTKYLEDSSRPNINLSSAHAYLTNHLVSDNMDDHASIDTVNYTAVVVTYIHTLCQALCHGTSIVDRLKSDMELFKTIYVGHYPDVELDDSDEPTQIQEPVKSTPSKANQNVRHMIASHARERASEGDNCLIAHCVGPTIVITDVCTDNTRRMDSQIDDLIEVASSKGYNISLGGITYVVEPKE